MQVAWSRKPQCLLEQYLARRGIEQIGSADDIGDPLCGIVDHYRHRSVEKRTYSDDPEEAASIPAVPDAAMEKAICRCMADLVPTLKPEYADAITTVELGEQNIEAYSKANKLTQNNATVRLHRARQSG